MSGSQFEYLIRDLEEIDFSIPEEELDLLTNQISASILQTNIFGDAIEPDEDEIENPVAILRGNLVGISDNIELATWHFALAVYLHDEIVHRNLEENRDLANHAIHALNTSKQYLEAAKRDEKRADKVISKYEREKSSNRAKKRYAELDNFKAAVITAYEPTILKLHKAGQKITYENVAIGMSKELSSQNFDKNGNPFIGKDGDFVGALKDFLERLKEQRKIKTTKHYRKTLSA